MFGGYYAIDRRMRRRMLPLLQHAAERKALLVYLPGYLPQQEPRITRVMPSILENMGEESPHGVAHGVGSGFAGHCDGQAVACQEGCGVGEASAGHGAEGRAVGAEHYVEGAFAYADDFFAVVHGCIQRFSPRAATPR